MFRALPMRRRVVCALFALAGWRAAVAAPALAADPLVPPAWLAAHRDDPRVVVLDIRPPADYAAGHVPGAVSADYETGGWRAARPSGAAAALPPVGRIAALIGSLGVGDDDHAVIVGDDFAAAARV